MPPDIQPRAQNICAHDDNLGTVTFYDKADRPTEVENAENEVTTTVYDAAGRSTALIDGEGETSQTVYDKADRTIAEVNPLGKRTTFSYDDAGRQTAVTNPLSQSSQTVYDDADRPTEQINPVGDVTTFVYDAAGRQVRTVDGNVCVTTTIYDNANRPRVTVNAEGNSVTTVYDAAGRVTAQVNERGFSYQTLYDKADRRTGTVNPLGQRHTFVYDPAGNQVRRIDARSQVTTYVYDEANRETGRQYQDGTLATFTYDPAGNRTLLEDWTGAYGAGYDRVNRVVTASAPQAGVITYSYDKVSRRKTMTDPDENVFQTDYDAAGQLTRLAGPQAGSTSYSYDDAGRQTLKELGNGTTASMIYDAAGRLERVVNLDSVSEVISSFDYDFDGVGNRTSQTDENGEFSNWTYDCTNQLDGDSVFTGWGWARFTLLQWKRFGVNNWATFPVDALATFNYNYVYDPTGNRLTQADLDAVWIVTNTYDNANRLQTSESARGITTYSYDANGNQSTIEEPDGEITTNTWDGVNKLVQVEHPDGSITTYAYNADGLRVEKDDGVDVTRFVYDGNNLLREMDDLGTLEAEFTYVPLPYANLVAQYREDESSFYHFDGIHNTSELTDSSGTVTDEYQHDPWGENFDALGTTPNAHTYKGEFVAYYRDPNLGPDSSFYSVGKRNLPAAQGRFNSEDPARSDLNLYRYARNNPIGEVDPSGLQVDEANERIRERLWKVDPAVADFVEQFDIRVANRPNSILEFAKNNYDPHQTKRDDRGKLYSELPVAASATEFKRLVWLRAYVRRTQQFKNWEKENYEYVREDRILPAPGTPEHHRYLGQLFLEQLELMRTAGATEEEVNAVRRDKLLNDIFGPGGLAETALFALGAPVAARGAVKAGQEGRRQELREQRYVRERTPQPKVQDVTGRPAPPPGTVIEPTAPRPSNPSLFQNQFPNEAPPPHTAQVRPSMFLRMRGAQWFDFVVLENGTLVVGQRIPGQGHANLAQGQPVRAAGQVQVSGGKVEQIDNASGHYLPSGAHARQAALNAFRNEGFQVPDSVYVEKIWNPQTKLWEPINGN